MTTPKPSTVRVRIAVAFDRDGEWEAYGEAGKTDAAATAKARMDEWARHIVWVEADVPMPELVTVEGSVVDA